MRLNYLLLAALTMSLINCGGVPPVPTDHFYRLTIHDQNINQLTGITDNIHISPFLAEGVYNERAILFSTDPESRELQQHHYHFWITTPPNLLRDYLVEYLRNTTTSTQVIPDNIKRDGIRIIGKVLGFEIINAETGKSARVKIEFTVMKHDDVTPALVKPYQSLQTISGEDFDETVKAVNMATDHIYQEFVQDLNQL